MHEELEALERSILDKPKQEKFINIFKGGNLRRTVLVGSVNFFQQAVGQSFSSQYSTIFIKQMGTIDAFAINQGNNAIQVGGILLSFWLADQFGRR